jgi:ABC-type antimicrobial peptide transport system permease subunit
MLVKLMIILGLVCIIIAVLGVFMAITLACQERRREIAVRKVHGASVKDIAFSLLREYAVVLVVSAALSFTIGSIVMHSWLQNFAKIATIRWWIYAIILLAMALLIFASVARRVFRTARENPALVIKSE